MDSQTATDLGRQAILQILLIAGPILLAVLLIGLLISVFQTIANIQDQSVAFIPKLLAVVLAISFSLPWLIGKLTDYGESVIGGAGHNVVHQSSATPLAYPLITPEPPPLIADRTELNPVPVVANIE